MFVYRTIYMKETYCYIQISICYILYGSWILYPSPPYKVIMYIVVDVITSRIIGYICIIAYRKVL